MAKKRKKKDEKDEDLGFKIPKFNEKEFLKKERMKIKGSFLTFLFALLMAFICFGFWVLLKENPFRWILVLLVGLINLSFLKYVFDKFKIDTDDFDKKQWFKTGAIYFFSWLLILIVIVNPPFYDEEPPIIQDVVLPEMQEPGGTVKIIAHITDNAGIDKNTLEFSLTDPNGTKSNPEYNFENNMFSYTHQKNQSFNDEEETYEYTLQIDDNSGYTTKVEGSFSYSENAIYLALPNSGDSVRAAQDIKFKVNPSVNRVFYKVDNQVVNTTLEKDTGYYQTSPKKIGWEKETNVSINVYAEVVHYFNNIPKQYNNTIEDTDEYYFQVTDDPEIGTEKSPNVGLPEYNPVQVPGFEILVFLISLIGVALIVKYSRKNR